MNKKIYKEKNRKIIKPISAKCSDRSNLPKKNLKSGHPEDWLSSNILSQLNLYGVSFDFFINWETKQLNNEIWIKGLLIDDITDINIFLKEMDSVFNFKTIKQIVQIFNSLADIYFIIIPDNQDWKSNNSYLYKIKVNSFSKRSSFTINKITINNFIDDIKKLTKKSIRSGKGLIYGTSLLECYLANNTDSPYPGDADMLLFNNENIPFLLLEFKKHTKETEIEKQNLNNYYPKPDNLKYQRLSILKHTLEQRYKKTLLFCVIYYPTQQHILKWKIEEIKVNINNTNIELFSGKSDTFFLPKKDNYIQYKEVLQNIIKFYNITNHK